MDDRPVVPADQVGGYLARHRPPACRAVQFQVPPHEEIGPRRHEATLSAILVEMLNIWPAGTALVIHYNDHAYAQALAYPPALMTEIGRVDNQQLTRAVSLGWMNPLNIPERHPDFSSQPQWIDNPVREWDYPLDTVPEIAGFVVAGVREVLDVNPALGYLVDLFNERRHGDDPEPTEPPTGDEWVEAPAVEMVRIGAGRPQR